MHVLTVLRSGGEYGPQHVQAVQRQVAKWAPDARFTCLSDLRIRGIECISLRSNWPGWWSKIELFRSDVPDDFLYTDLDNVILGPLDFAWPNEFTADIGFSFFRVTPDVDRQFVHEQFRRRPGYHMAEWNPGTRQDGKFGDAAFLRSQCSLDPANWSSDVRNVVDLSPPCPWRLPPLVLPADVRVLLCGGKRRRPWLHHSASLRQAYWCEEKQA